LSDGVCLFCDVLQGAFDSGAGAYCLGQEMPLPGVLACQVLYFYFGIDALQGRRLGPWMDERALESWFSLPATQRRL